MTSNLLGSLLIMAIFGAGALAFYVVLSRTKVLDAATLNNGWTAETLRRNYKYIVALELAAGAVVGWFVGPILFEALGVSP